MSARDTLADSPLIPTPVDRESGDTHVLYGHCAWWCGHQTSSVLPNGNRGNTIEEHCEDPFCMGRVGQVHEATGVHGRTTYLTVELFTVYQHGIYRRTDLGMRESKIAIGFSSDNDHCDEGMVFMNSSAVRSLAASLLRAADELEGLGRGTL